MRLIDADALIEAIRHDVDQTPNSDWGYGLNHAIPIVRSQPTIDAIELLKEQEPKPVVYTDNPYTGLPVATCPKCGRFAIQFHMAQPGEETHFCPWCGQEVKWNEIDRRNDSRRR